MILLFFVCAVSPRQPLVNPMSSPDEAGLQKQLTAQRSLWLQSDLSEFIKISVCLREWEVFDVKRWKPDSFSVCS